MTTLQDLYQDNRVLTAILFQRERMAGMNGIGINGTPLADLDPKLSDLSPAEIRRYNDTRAIAQGNGTLSHQESQTIYACLNAQGWTDAADLPAKVVILHLMGELLI